MKIHRRFGETHRDRILRGAKVVASPLSKWPRGKFVVSTKRARVLGLTIPPTLLARADEVIE